MDTKHIHCMLEKISEYGKCMMEEMVGNGNVNLQDAGEIVDMVKDLAEAEYHALIAREMRKAHEEEEEEEKYLLNRLKEEYKDEYRQMEERYGEDADRRFYDSWRHADGTFARKGTGSYRPRSSGRRGRRGYMEPPYLHIPYDYRYDMDDYDYADAERMRDMDRTARNKMYFSEPMRSVDMDGRYPGRRDGDMAGSRVHDAREGKSWEKRRGYMETKEMHKDNTPESKQQRMKELDSYAKDLTEDVIEMVSDASPEERALIRQKIQILAQKIPQ